MTVDPLEQVLNLVAEGRLTAEEAAPILAAMEAQPAGAGGPGRSRPAGADGFARGFGDAFADGFAAGFADPPDGDRGGSRGGPGSSADPHAAASALRIEVRDGGRSVVNLRLPIAVGRLAVDRVPGISSDAAERVREALRTGMRGPVLEVDEGNGDGVRIVLE